MSLEVKRQQKETTQSLVRRFARRMQKSRILLRAKKAKFKERQKSPQMKKRAALRKEELKKKYEMLKKMGKQYKR